jgi:thioredoxin reductase
MEKRNSVWRLTALALLALALVFTGCEGPEGPIGLQGPTGPEGSEGPKGAGYDESVDVVVIGGGIAGMATAIELKTQNPELKVVVLEKQARTGGSLWSSSGYIGTTSNSTQSFTENTTPDQVVEFLEYYIGTDMINKPFIKKLYELAEYVTNNFIAWGVDFNSVAAPGSPNTTPSRVKARDPHQERGIIDSGGRKVQLWYYGPARDPDAGITSGNGTAYLAVAQTEKAEAIGVDVRLLSKATELIDVNSGTNNNRSVIGVKVDDAGKSYNLYAKAVMLATGGYSSNGELVKELTGDFYKNVPTAANPYSGNPGATGDVFGLVQKLGVPLIGKGVMAYAGAYGSPQNFPANRFFINLEGQRYMDEYSWGYGITFGTREQEGGGWRLVSTNDTAVQATFDTYAANNSNIKGPEGIPYFVGGATLANLATALGLSGQAATDFVANLTQTVTEYNAAYAAHENDINKDVTLKIPGGAVTQDQTITGHNPLPGEQPTAWLATMTPVLGVGDTNYKFYAQRITFTTAGSLISIRTDNDTRVVNSNYGSGATTPETAPANQRITGLYAAGECAISNQFFAGLYAGSGFGVGSSAYNGVLGARTIIADFFTPAP